MLHALFRTLREGAIGHLRNDLVVSRLDPELLQLETGFRVHGPGRAQRLQRLPQRFCVGRFGRGRTVRYPLLDARADLIVFNPGALDGRAQGGAGKSLGEQVRQLGGRRGVRRRAREDGGGASKLLGGAILVLFGVPLALLGDRVRRARFAGRFDGGNTIRNGRG